MLAIARWAELLRNRDFIDESQARVELEEKATARYFHIAGGGRLLEVYTPGTYVRVVVAEHGDMHEWAVYPAPNRTAPKTDFYRHNGTPELLSPDDIIIGLTAL